MKNLWLPLAGGALACGGMMQTVTAQEATEHPNIIYVFPDQYRNMAMGFWNNPEYRQREKQRCYGM